MQIKFVNTDTLDATIVNIRNGTFDEVLAEAAKTLPLFDSTILQRNGDIFRLNNYIGEIIYHGVPKAETRLGRKEQNWDDKLEVFKKYYKPTMSAKELSVISELSLGHVYYIARKFGFELKAVRQRRK